MGETGLLYRDCRRRITDLVSGLTAARAATPVPACPAWTVQDVVAHLVGVTDDALHGRMEGAPGEAWTAKHVEARRGRTLAELLPEWAANAATFEGLPLPYQAVADVASHEQDLRGALHQPGARDNRAIAFVVPLLLDRVVQQAASHWLPPLEIVTPEQSVVAGADNDGDLVRLRTTSFEVFRSILGRRSRAQVERYDWQGDPTPYLERYFAFGPAEHDIVE